MGAVGKVLMIEDEVEIYNLANLYFAKEGIDLDHVKSGQDAIVYLNRSEPELILLDVGLPDISGFDIINKIKEITDVPVIFLTSKGRIQDQIKGLKSGADDYILKPFHPQLLTEKVLAHLKRSKRVIQKKNNDSVLKYGRFEINFETQKLKIDQRQVRLTQTEFDILSILAKNPGVFYTSDAIYEKLWFENSMGDTRGVLVHVSNLRRKLGLADSETTYIMTKRNYGYKFNEYIRSES